MSTDNIDNSFLELGQYIASSKKPEVIENLSGQTYNQVYADLTTSFTILIGIFFPSVTGELIFGFLFLIKDLKV
jgi:solute carrier family 12 (potassium/chloride transporter), member 4/6